VDVVADGHLLDSADDSIDLKLYYECFEHNPFWRETFANMCRITKAGGVAFTCASRGRVEHGTRRTSPVASPGTQKIGWDYYRNLEESDFRGSFDFDKMFSSFVFLKNNKHRDLYFAGRKLGMSKNHIFYGQRLVREYIDLERLLEESAQRQRSRLGRLLFRLYQLSQFPLRLTQFLPDPQFQRVAVHTKKF
jgi:hypothetical protein